MRKKLTEQDNCYTPKYLVDYFGRFDYDPATTKEQAEYLYKTRYWGRYKCDYMPDALSIALFDYVFLSGQKGAEDLQKVLGVKIDGIIGNQTLCACNSQPLRKIVEEYFKLRMDYVIYLGNKPKFKKYRQGWINRVNHIKTVCEGLC